MLSTKIKGTQWIISAVAYDDLKIFQGVSNLCLFNHIPYNENGGIKRNYRKSKSVVTCEKSNSIEKTDVNELDLGDKLVKWAIQNNISSLSFSKLLKVLWEHGFEDLPKNSRVLLKAKEEEIRVSKVPPGIYIHFGLKKNLRKLMLELISKNLFKKTNIRVSIFIDNLLLSKLTQQGLWVILGSVRGFTKNIFFVGAYRGYSKPVNSNLFLSEFVSEAKHLCTEGLEINDVIYNVRISTLICDAPAKAFILNIKGFNGYSSCTKCNIVGEFKAKNVCFPKKSTPRLDEDYEKDEIYHSDKTNLLEIPHFGVVSNVTLDYMHLVCLGVVRKMLTIWMKGTQHWICSDSASDVVTVSAPLCPNEFGEKPKSFKKLPLWGGNDFRKFLLYYGPAALRGNLKEEYFDHFLLLHVACRLLCTEASPENVDHGRKFLSSFVEDYIRLYNKEQVTHNFHGLYHLAEECASHGTLDSFSAFPFEKFLLQVRNSMKKSRKKQVPHTILRESYERVFTKGLDKLTGANYTVGRKIGISDGNQFENFSLHEKLKIGNFVIAPSSIGDKYALLKNNKIIEVTSVLEKKEKSNKTHFVAGKEFCSISNFHSEPFSALDLNMYTVGQVSDATEIWPVNMIYKKCMKIIGGSKETVMVGLLDENF